MTAERNAQGVLETIEEAGQLLVTCPDIELGVQVAKGLEAARAAVAELVEAARAIKPAECPCKDCARLAAALAKFPTEGKQG